MDSRSNGASRVTKTSCTKKSVFAPLGLEFVTWVTTSYLHRHGQRLKKTVLQEGRERTRQGEDGSRNSR